MLQKPSTSARGQSGSLFKKRGGVRYDTYTPFNYNREIVM